VFRKAPDKDPVVKQVKLKAGTYPIKIVHFGRGQTNLTYAQYDVPGTLYTLVKRQGKFPELIDDKGDWKARNDVIYKGVISAVGQGPLKAGIQGNTIGPELGFGWVMGEALDEPVLLIKASIGNRSLGWDILPPGSPRYTYEGTVYAGYKDTAPSWKEGEEPKPVNWYAGKQYDDYTAAIHEVLNNFGTLFPDFKDQGYEVAGFVWWQGHKDSGSAAHIAHYEENLVHLIEAWRKEFNAPKAPWVIATVGFHGDKLPAQFRGIFDAQMAVADPQKHPELAGTVATVDTRPFWREPDVSPRPQDYHYNRNAETYYLVGEALGRAMVELQGRQ
jgi:alpha-galactosidase